MQVEPAFTAVHTHVLGVLVGIILRIQVQGLLLLCFICWPQATARSFFFDLLPHPRSATYPNASSSHLDWTAIPPDYEFPLQARRFQQPLAAQPLIHELDRLAVPLIAQHPDWEETQLTKQFYQFYLGYDAFSRLRYERGVHFIHTQRDREALAEFMVQQRWTQEVLERYSTHPDYGHLPGYLFRTLATIQTAAHFFEIPYPTLFCLFFQESKLDYRMVSRTGARGVGQLTSIALRQVMTLREEGDNERLLELSVQHLGQVYRDPLFRQWMNHLDLTLDFPLPEKPRMELRVATPTLYTMVSQTSKLLRRARIAYGKDEGLIWVLVRKIRHGEILPERYSKVHWAYDQIAERYLASEPQSVFNIETNILLSAMLLKHYYDYTWKNRGHVIELKPEVRAMMAIAAYNNGQSGIRRFLAGLENEFRLSLRDASAEWVASKFTARRLSRALRRPYSKIREVSRHIRHITACSEQEFPFR